MFKHIILFVMLVMSPLLFGQHHKIKGTISDETKFPVAGVIIQLQNNPSIATQTDANGLYTLNFIPSKNKWLLLHFKTTKTASLM